MSQFKALILGPNSFISTLVELKLFLKFNLIEDASNIDNSKSNFDIIIFHEEALENTNSKNVINNSNSIKILVSSKNDRHGIHDSFLKLPSTINEINSIVEVSRAKKIFTKNSSVQIKEYFLDKNQRYLIKDDDFIILTEKEIQLLDLFLNHKKPISKNQILSLVWHYSSDADTHTVETHIYRLRKKISSKFLDEKFILNNKDGYYL